jgi:hypothetical protein
MKCPRCGLINPDIAQRCDCGYDFHRKKVDLRYAIPTARTEALKEFFVVVATVAVIVFLLWLLPSFFWAYLMFSHLLKLIGLAIILAVGAYTLIWLRQGRKKLDQLDQLQREKKL